MPVFPGCRRPLVRLASQHAGERVVARSPLINLAVALMLDPDLPRKVRRLHVMGGALGYPGNVTPAAEFNFYADPDAARQVLAAGFDLVLVDWDVAARHTLLGADRLACIEALGRRLSRFFLDIHRHVLRFYRARGLDGTYRPDALTVAVAPEPQGAPRRTRAHVAVECQGDLTRGYSAMDLDGRTGRPPNAEVVLAADGERFWQMLIALLTTA